MTRGFTRHEIAQILELDEEFVAALERESILFVDTPGSQAEFSRRMLDRARVAHSLVEELEINLAGVAVILRMREDLGRLRANLRSLGEVLRERNVRP